MPLIDLGSNDSEDEQTATATTMSPTSASSGSSTIQQRQQQQQRHYPPPEERAFHVVEDLDDDDDDQDSLHHSRHHHRRHSHQSFRSEQRSLVQESPYRVAPIVTLDNNSNNAMNMSSNLLTSTSTHSRPTLSPGVQRARQVASMVLDGSVRLPHGANRDGIDNQAPQVDVEDDVFHDEDIDERSNRERRELVATVLSNTPKRRFLTMPNFVKQHKQPKDTIPVHANHHYGYNNNHNSNNNNNDRDMDEIDDEGDGIYHLYHSHPLRKCWTSGFGICLGVVGLIAALVAIIVVSTTGGGGSGAKQERLPTNTDVVNETPPPLLRTAVPSTSPTVVSTLPPTTESHTLQPSAGTSRTPPPRDAGWKLKREIQGNGDDGAAVPDEEWGYTVSVNQDGTRLAMGSTRTDTGHVRIFGRNVIGDPWILYGNPIAGRSDGDFAGVVRISGDGMSVAIGAFGNNRATGHVRVFSYDSRESDGQWTQVGQDIVGNDSGDEAGWSVAINDDGTVVAVGAHRNDGGGTDSGHVRVYSLPETGLHQPTDGEPLPPPRDEAQQQWFQLGQDLEGTAPHDFAGWSVDISGTGRIVAFGAVNAGWVRSYSFDAQRDTWKVHGQGIVGDTTKDQTGYSVSLSFDGWTMAIGETLWETVGRVRIFAFNGQTLQWDPLGSPLKGTNPQDAFGTSVALTSDGRTVAISAMGYDEEDASGTNNFFEGTNVGMARVYHFFDGDWQEVGDTLKGTEAQEVSGWRNAVSLSEDGFTLAVGAPRNTNEAGAMAGVVRVYERSA